MKDVYGSPDLGDPTSKWEKRVERAAARLADRIKRQRSLNRTLGSKPVSAEDQHLEWRMNAHDPLWWGQMFEKFTQGGLSSEQAAIEMDKHDKDMKAVK